jgi:uncharacterized protein (TIGR02145 family)
LTGFGVYKWVNGDKYEGSFFQNERMGWGKNSSANGKVEEGYFVKNVFKGKGSNSCSLNANNISQMDLKSIQIGNQIWSTEDLNTSYFTNGEPIPQAKSNEEWFMAASKKQPAWCYYNNDSTIGVKYGKLYNWYAVNDPRGIAPIGWHIPSNDEWIILENYLGGMQDAGKKIISTNDCSTNRNETNESGFSGIPGGNRGCTGAFGLLNEQANWWSSTEYDSINAYSKTVACNKNNVDSGGRFKKMGMSVRCIKN